MRRNAWILVCAALFSVTTSAHHSNSRYDGDRRTTLEGVIRDVEWAYPHVYLLLETEDDAGNGTIWEIEGLTPHLLTDVHGWNRDSVQAGDEVSVTVSLNSNPDRHEVRGHRVVKSDGTNLLLYERPTSQEQEERPAARASDIAGVWSATQGLGGRFAYENDQSGPTTWNLTDAGENSIDSFTFAKKLDYACQSGGPPINVAFSSNRMMIEIRDNVVLISTSALGLEERIVRMDRDSLEDLPFVYGGQSIGRWDGDILVVETGRFLPEPMGNADRLASSSHKRLTERFALTADGSSLRYSLELEDPVYLPEPVTMSMEWKYRPDLDFSEVEPCVEETARRGFEYRGRLVIRYP